MYFSRSVWPSPQVLQLQRDLLLDRRAAPREQAAQPERVAFAIAERGVLVQQRQVQDPGATVRPARTRPAIGAGWHAVLLGSGSGGACYLNPVDLGRALPAYGRRSLADTPSPPWASLRLPGRRILARISGSQPARPTRQVPGQLTYKTPVAPLCDTPPGIAPNSAEYRKSNGRPSSGGMSLGSSRTNPATTSCPVGRRSLPVLVLGRFCLQPACLQPTDTGNIRMIFLIGGSLRRVRPGSAAGAQRSAR